MHCQHKAGPWRVEFENLPCSEPQSTMSENLHKMRLAPNSQTRKGIHCGDQGQVVNADAMDIERNNKGIFS